MIAKITNPVTTRRAWLMAVAVGLSIAAGLLAWHFAPGFQGKSENVSIGRTLWVTDLSDDRKMVGLAHDVFFGRVTENLGQTIFDEFPRTHFKVEVLETLKGSLSGAVKVNQEGGTFEDGTPFRMDGDPDLLETGKSYLFATLTSPERLGGGRLVISGGYGKIQLPEVSNPETQGVTGNTGSGETPDEEGATNTGPGGTPGTEGAAGNTDATRILSGERAAELRARFTDAVENEIPYVPGD